MGEDRAAAEAEFLAGVRAWHDHSWHRDLADPPVVWREGPARLLDYGGHGRTVLFVPSLVNRWTILDLMEGHSMMRWLASGGVHPVLLDWGEPEAAFDLSDYIAGRLVRAMAAMGERVVLAGYCMGGTFTAAAAALRPDLIDGLILLAAPWDFHAGDGVSLAGLTAARRWLDPIMRRGMLVPADALHLLFAWADPDGIAAKFRRFASMDGASTAARMFVAIEDWLNDGIALSGAAARACFDEWYAGNLPARGLWRVGGSVIDPETIDTPALAVVPRRDRIVPPASADALARALPNATCLSVPAGHVGMTAGGAARRILWAPVLDWIKDLPASR